MARGVNPSRLASVIKQLHSERQDLQRRIDEIDNIFAQCGITAGAAPAKRGPGRPAGTGAAMSENGAGGRGRRRRRGKFGTSGTTSVLEMVKAAGKGGASSKEISEHWKSQGRSGDAYITLGQLVKTGRLKKKSVAGQRGSQYFAA